MARKKMKDIDGFRSSHRAIPTAVKLADEEAEMAARSGAVARTGPSLKDKKPGKVPLRDFGFNPDHRMGRLSGDGTGANNAESDWLLQRSRRADADPNSFNQWFPGDTDDAGRLVDAQGNVITETETVTEDNQLTGNRLTAQQILDEQLDREERERRIARARAAQEAMVRATMGAGEAGRSGASALLEGEAGRLAESQARVMEMQRELGLADLAMYLEGFDLGKERYDAAEKRQAAMAAYYVGSMWDMDYKETMDFLQMPESARTKEGEKEFNEWREANAAEDEEDEEEEEIPSYTGKEDIGPSGADIVAWASGLPGTMTNDSGFDAWPAKAGEYNWNGPMPAGYMAPSNWSTAEKTINGETFVKIVGNGPVIWIKESEFPGTYGEGLSADDLPFI